MNETATILISEIIEVSEQVNLKLSRCNNFVPESQLILGEKIKNVELLSKKKFSIVSSEKKEKRILVYTLEKGKGLIWESLKIDKIINGALNVDQIDYFVSRNKDCFINCKGVTVVELDGRCFFIQLNDIEKRFYKEINFADQIPEDRIKIFFAVNY